MSGWIALSRKLWTHDFFKSGPMTEREAWMWMIAKAAYEDTTHRVGDDVLPVPRGTFMVTLRELQSTFMWASDTRVRNFLKRLKDERMIRWEIVGRKNAPKTHVTICNYNDFQSSERTKERTEKRTENAPSGSVNNKDNNITTLPNGRDSDAVEDFAKELFDRGVAFLCRHGVQERSARAMIGKWRSSYDDPQIFAAFKACQKAGAVEPISWITAHLAPAASTDWEFNLDDFKEEARQ